MVNRKEFFSSRKRVEILHKAAFIALDDIIQGVCNSLLANFWE
jgi:hypothetical protein